VGVHSTHRRLVRAYCGRTEPARLPLREIPMSDKSPRQSMSKKSAKSLKAKRAEKRSKVAGEASADRIASAVKKK
jgi:hypothetical protein